MTGRSPERGQDPEVVVAGLEVDVHPSQWHSTPAFSSAYTPPRYNHGSCGDTFTFQQFPNYGNSGYPMVRYYYHENGPAGAKTCTGDIVVNYGGNYSWTDNGCGW